MTKAITKDFYNTGLTMEEIAAKHNVDISIVMHLAHKEAETEAIIMSVLEDDYS